MVCKPEEPKMVYEESGRVREMRAVYEYGAVWS